MGYVLPTPALNPKGANVLDRSALSSEPPKTMSQNRDMGHPDPFHSDSQFGAFSPPNPPLPSTHAPQPDPIPTHGRLPLRHLQLRSPATVSRHPARAGGLFQHFLEPMRLRYRAWPWPLGSAAGAGMPLPGEIGGPSGPSVFEAAAGDRYFRWSRSEITVKPDVAADGPIDKGA